jgi:hypothetical protein
MGTKYLYKIEDELYNKIKKCGAKEKKSFPILPTKGILKFAYIFLKDKKNQADFKEAVRENLVQAYNEQLKDKNNLHPGNESAHRFTSGSVESHIQAPRELKIDTTVIPDGKSLKKDEFSNNINFPTSNTKQQTQPKTPGDWKEFTHLGKREIIRPVFYKKNNDGNPLASPQDNRNSSANEKQNQGTNLTPNKVRPASDYQQDSLKVKNLVFSFFFNSFFFCKVFEVSGRKSKITQ